MDPQNIARWGHSLQTICHPGTVLHHFGRIAISPTRSNPAAFENLSTCMMVDAAKSDLGEVDKLTSLSLTLSQVV